MMMAARSGGDKVFITLIGAQLGQVPTVKVLRHVFLITMSWRGELRR